MSKRTPSKEAAKSRPVAVEPFQRERVIASSFADTHGIAPSVRDELAQALADYRVELKAVWDKTRAWNERRGL